MNLNKIVFFTLALFMGAAQFQIFPMEQPELQRNTRTAQAFKRVLYQMIEKIPASESGFPMDYLFLLNHRPQLEAVSAFIQGTLLEPAPETVGLIAQKNLGEVLYDAARLQKHPATMAWLVKHGLINSQYRFSEALPWRDLKDAEYWLLHGANIDEPNEDGYTPLLQAVGSISLCTPLITIKQTKQQADDLKLIMFLLEHGADVNARDLQGRTALWYLMSPSCFEGLGGRLIKELINRGARSDIKNDQGESVQSFLNQYRKLDETSAREVSKLVELGIAKQLGLEPETKGEKNEN